MHNLFPLASLLTMFLAAACGGFRVTELDPAALQGTPTVEGQVVFRATIPSTEARRKYLGVDPVSQGVIPVHLVCANHANTSFALLPDRIRATPVGTADSRAPSPRAHLMTPTNGLNVGLACVLILVAIIPGLVVSGIFTKQAFDRDIVNWNYATKQLRSTTLSPGEAVAGLLYFDAADKAAPRQLVLDVELLDLATRSARHVRVTTEEEVK